MMIAYNSSVYSPTLNILYCEKMCRMGLYIYLCYHPYLVSLLSAVLLSLHLVIILFV